MRRYMYVHIYMYTGIVLPEPADVSIAGLRMRYELCVKFMGKKEPVVKESGFSRSHAEPQLELQEISQQLMLAVSKENLAAVQQPR